MPPTQQEQTAPSPARRGYRPGSYVGRRLGGPFDILFGVPVRLLLALSLIGVCVKWRIDNRDAVAAEWQKMQGSRVDHTRMDPRKFDPLRPYEMSPAPAPPEPVGQMVQIPFVPQSIRASLSSWNTLAAGILLFLSLFTSAMPSVIIVCVAAALMVFGHHVQSIANLPLGGPRIAAFVVGVVLGTGGLLLGGKLR